MTILNGYTVHEIVNVDDGVPIIVTVKINQEEKPRVRVDATLSDETSIGVIIRNDANPNNDRILIQNPHILFGKFLWFRYHVNFGKADFNFDFEIEFKQSGAVIGAIKVAGNTGKYPIDYVVAEFIEK